MPLKTTPVLPKLNDRQRQYLVAAYQLDQQLEAEHKQDYHRGIIAPAHEWRRMPYGRWQHFLTKPPTRLRQLIEQEQEASNRRLVDPGTGSTWKALAERGLVEVTDCPICVPGLPLREQYDLPHVSLTRAGRKLARELLGEIRPPRPKKAPPPEGRLPYLAWRALAAAYAQAPQGLVARQEGTEGFERVLYGGILFAWLEPLLAPGLLVARPASSATPLCYDLTAKGRDYYHQYFHVNQAAHPRVAAELPRPPLTPAQAAFWEELAELDRQKTRLIGPTNAARRAVLAVTRASLRRKLAAELGTLWVAPYWYPTLAGVGLATSGGRSGVALQLPTEQEAQAEGQRRRQLWQRELDVVFDYEELS